MRSKFKKFVVYILATAIIAPLWIMSGFVTARPAMAAILPGTLSAEDFGVVDYNTGATGQLKGYTSGFGLTDATFTDASVVVRLYAAGDQLLQTNTLDGPNADTITGIQISSPFDISGTFNYTTDGYWTNQRAVEYGQSIAATKVIATVTLANGKIVTAENTNLTGDPATVVLPGTLSAEDFGVVDYNTGATGQLKGYTSGFGLTDATFTDASVVVRLYAAGDQLLQTNTLDGPNADTITGIQISSPFDISGTFNYTTDGYWTNQRAVEYGQSIAATKVIATVTLANGKIVTAENTNLTGDPATVIPFDTSAPIVSVSNPTDKIVRVTFDGVGGGVSQYEINLNGVLSQTQNVVGNDLGVSYSYDISVADYGSYEIVVKAIFGGIVVESELKKIDISAPYSAPAQPVTTVQTTLSVAPETAEAAAPESSVTSQPSNSDTTDQGLKTEEEGKIKGEESNTEQTEEKINWTPWIILFVLIILAGAATGGYFYWFAGEEEVQTKVKTKPEVEKKEVAKPKSKSGSAKKPRRW